MSEYCINLNLHINPLIDGLSIEDIKPTNESRSNWILVNLDYINPELKEFFDSKGLVIKIAGLFIVEENQSGAKHLDGTIPSDLAKINWSYNTNHNMIWYKIKNNSPHKNVNVLDSKLGTRPYIDFQDDELEEIHRQPVGFPSIVQAGIPHNVENYEGVRRCLTIALLEKTQKPGVTRIVTMSRAKKIFAEYLVLGTGIEPVFTT